MRQKKMNNYIKIRINNMNLSFRKKDEMMKHSPLKINIKISYMLINL